METLIDLRNHLYCRGERWWTASFIAALIVFFLTIAGVWSQAKGVTALVGLSALLVPVLVTWMREIGSVALLKADKCRRLVLFSDSLGHDLPTWQVAEIRGWALGASIRQAPFIAPYYKSRIEAGPRRLADNIAESAFFTNLLSSKARNGLYVMAAAGVLGVLATLALADLFSSSQFMALAIKSVALFVAFLTSSDFALLAKKYGDLANEAQKSFSSATRFTGEANPSIEEVRTVAEEYGIALLQAPPLPSWLYRYYRNELNRTYRESHR